MKKIKLNKKTLLPACYMTYLLLWMAVQLVYFIGDGLRPEQPLDAALASVENMTIAGDGLFVTENTDPQLIFTGLDTRVRLVQLSADFSITPGEMELFYSKNPDGGFSAAKRVIGIPQADGSYLYRLPAGRVGSLRIDPGTAGGNEIRIRKILLNPYLPAAAYFVPNLRDIFAFAVLPALALAAFYTIIEIILAAKNRVKSRKEAITP